MLDIQSIRHSWQNHNFSSDKSNQFLRILSSKIILNIPKILDANSKDLAKLSKEDYKYPRLVLTQNKLITIADSLIQLQQLDANIFKISDQKNLPNGLSIRKQISPIGVIAVIYESRPNVTIDVACLCLKSGNACILKGGKEAWNSNSILVKIIHKSMEESGIDINLVNLIDNNQDQIQSILEAKGTVDLIIPRGSKKLIDFVTSNSKVPVIETGASPVHIFVDKIEDPTKTANIIYNSKSFNNSACNALDTLIINRSELSKLKPVIKLLNSQNTIFYCTKADFKILTELGINNLTSAEEDIFDQEYLSNSLNLKIVENIDEAITHIQKFSLGHSDGIITSNQNNISKFQNSIDSGCIFVNTPTCFADGFEFGLGAEIGISTQKLHARGPMGLEALTTYKCIVESEFEVRK